MCPEAHCQLRDFRHSRRCNRLRPMALQTVQVSVEPRLSTVLKDRSVVPSSKRLSVCTFPTALSLYIAQGGLRKDTRYISRLFSKAETLPFEKEIRKNHQLGLFFLLEACEQSTAGWSTAGLPAKLPPRPIVIHHSLGPAARALKRQAPCLYIHWSTRHSQNGSTHRPIAMVYVPLR